jgi:hypothetical protein
MAWITIARRKSRRPETLFAEPDAAAARIEAIRAARIASHRVAAERLESALRAAEEDAAGSALPPPAGGPPAWRRPVV